MLGEDGIIITAKKAKNNYANAVNEEEERLTKVLETIENSPKDTGEDVSKKIEELQTGDYIKYDTGIASVGENGVIVCRVIYPLNSEYGLQIISDKNVGEDITFEGNDWETAKNSYNEAIKTLNNSAERYINKDYAYDARCVGSIPTVKDKKFIDKNEGTKTTVVLPSNYKLASGWTNRDTGCFGEDTHYTTDEIALGTTMKNTGQRYWLASRFENFDTSAYDFDIRGIDANGNLNYYYICGVKSYGEAFGNNNPVSNGIRVCILIKSDIVKIIKGDGKTEETAYIMEK